MKKKTKKQIKRLFNHESPKSIWEITNKVDDKIIELTFWPEDADRPKKEFSITYCEFIDLLKFTKTLKKAMKNKTASRGFRKLKKAMKKHAEYGNGKLILNENGTDKNNIEENKTPASTE